MKKIIVTTGGTGGHIFPALAVVQELKKKFPGLEVLFMGGLYGPEAELAAKAGLEFIGLPVHGVLGRGLKGITAAFKMLKGILTARRVIRRFKPDLVLGFGGYAAFAAVAAGRSTGIPTAIHEQNSVPGASNRLLGRIVQRIYLSMPDSRHVFQSKKTLLVGNPVRSELIELYEQKVARMSGSAGHGTAQNTEKTKRLLVMGGSLGARALNEAVMKIVPVLAEQQVEIRHQTGQADYEKIRAFYTSLGVANVRVEAFITDVKEAYTWADLIYCRAGASTLAEITSAGLPAVLTPFPFAAQNHQLHNAKHLVAKNCAVLMEQKDLTASDSGEKLLASLLLGLLDNRKQLAEMSKNCLETARPYAAEVLVDDLVLLLRKQDS